MRGASISQRVAQDYEALHHATRCSLCGFSRRSGGRACSSAAAAACPRCGALYSIDPDASLHEQAREMREAGIPCDQYGRTPEDRDALEMTVRGW